MALSFVRLKMKYFCSMNIFSGTLLDWYAENKRDLPWRNTTDPYLIWISEIILQQTRVAQGYEYFLRFIKRFPDVASLAAASEDEVMKYWQGVGDYTAAAICSFAYDMPYAAVDGNVYRVLSRYFGIDVPIDSTEGKKTFTALAGEVLDKSRPADYNQAIMDFGAVQCTPQSPNCLFCPLSGSCRALSEGKVQQLPVKQHRTKTTNRYFNYIYVRMGAHTLIHKRTEDDIWKNLFELPLVETEKDLSEEEFLACPQFHALFAEGEVRMVRTLLRGVKHVLSHRVIYTNFYEVTLPDNSSSFSSYQRVAVEDLDRYAVPRLIHAFLEKYV